jgi:hypothetical protein
MACLICSSIETSSIETVSSVIIAIIFILLQKYAILLILPNNWRFYFKIRQKETEADSR